MNKNYSRFKKAVLLFLTTTVLSLSFAISPNAADEANNKKVYSDSISNNSQSSTGSEAIVYIDTVSWSEISTVRNSDGYFTVNNCINMYTGEVNTTVYSNDLLKAGCFYKAVNGIVTREVLIDGEELIRTNGFTGGNGHLTVDGIRYGGTSYAYFLCNGYNFCADKTTNYCGFENDYTTTTYDIIYCGNIADNRAKVGVFISASAVFEQELSPNQNGTSIVYIDHFTAFHCENTYSYNLYYGAIDMLSGYPIKTKSVFLLTEGAFYRVINGNVTEQVYIGGGEISQATGYTANGTSITVGGNYTMSGSKVCVFYNLWGVEHNITHSFCYNNASYLNSGVVYYSGDAYTRINPVVLFGALEYPDIDMHTAGTIAFLDCDSYNNETLSDGYYTYGPYAVDMLTGAQITIRSDTKLTKGAFYRVVDGIVIYEVPIDGNELAMGTDISSTATSITIDDVSISGVEAFVYYAYMYYPYCIDNGKAYIGYSFYDRNCIYYCGDQARTNAVAVFSQDFDYPGRHITGSTIIYVSNSAKKSESCNGSVYGYENAIDMLNGGLLKVKSNTALKTSCFYRINRGVVTNAVLIDGETMALSENGFKGTENSITVNGETINGNSFAYYTMDASPKYTNNNGRVYNKSSIYEDSGVDAVYYCGESTARENAVVVFGFDNLSQFNGVISDISAIVYIDLGTTEAVDVIGSYKLYPNVINMGTGAVNETVASITELEYGRFYVVENGYVIREALIDGNDLQIGFNGYSASVTSVYIPDVGTLNGSTFVYFLRHYNYHRADKMNNYNDTAAYCSSDYTIVYCADIAAYPARVILFSDSDITFPSYSQTMQ